MKSLGVDVSERRGLDLVLLEGPARVSQARSRVAVEDLRRLLPEWKPEIVAIDSPPGRGVRGGARQAERELLRLGIHSYGTPSRPDQMARPAYGWMRVGFEVFAACERLGYARYSGGPVVAPCAAEVFPHASAVVLGGGLPPRGMTKEAFRRAVLTERGVPLGPLGSLDLVDAALAALTGLHALQGDFSTVGDAEDGFILLPTATRPTTPFRRCARRPQEEEPQRHLPRLAACACGDPECHATTDREFAPGHDAKRKSLLWSQARAGQEALEELRRRGWAIPPDLS
jgi:predicted nuclease with RNAse H fold